MSARVRTKDKKQTKLKWNICQMNGFICVHLRVLNDFESKEAKGKKAEYTRKSKKNRSTCASAFPRFDISTHSTHISTFQIDFLVLPLPLMWYHSDGCYYVTFVPLVRYSNGVVQTLRMNVYANTMN